MFGIYRIALALGVVTTHLLGIPLIGSHSVHGFFILSGFLMARVLNEVYGFTPSGVRAFSINRGLRLYPAYWIAIAFSACAIAWFGDAAAHQYRRFLYQPPDPLSVLENVTMIFPAWFPGLVEPRLSPPAWSLTVEIFYYAVMAIGACARRSTTVAWIILSAAFWVWGGRQQWNVDDSFFYGHLLAQSLPFACGAGIYHFRARLVACLEWLSLLGRPFPLCAAAIANSLLSAALMMHGLTIVQTYACFSNLLLQIALVVSLERYGWPTRVRRVDHWLGDMAYPVFLVHWPVGFVTTMLIFGTPERGLTAHGIETCLIAVIGSALFAWLLIVAVDRPVQRLRGKVRPRRRATAVAAPIAGPSPRAVTGKSHA